MAIGTNVGACLLCTVFSIISAGGAALLYHGIGVFYLKGEPASQFHRILLVGVFSFVGIFMTLLIGGIFCVRMWEEGCRDAAPTVQTETGEQNVTNQSVLLSNVNANAGQASGRPTSPAPGGTTIVTHHHHYHFIPTAPSMPTTVELHSDMDHDFPPSYEAALSK